MRESESERAREREREREREKTRGVYNTLFKHICSTFPPGKFHQSEIKHVGRWVSVLGMP